MGKMLNAKLSIVIPVFNKVNFTVSCLKDLSYLDVNLHEIIVVDNGSSDETETEVKKLQKRMPNLVYLKNESNLGFGAACNRGYSAAKNNCVMFLNNDIKVYANLPVWTDVYLTTLQENPNQIISPTGGFVDPKRNFDFRYETDGGKEFNYLSGWMLVATKETFNKLIENNNIGPFRTDLYWNYWEDTHLSFDAKRKEIPLKLLANNSVSHFGHITSKGSKELNLKKMFRDSKEVFMKEWGKK